ncbi:unnamed protein product, partial [Rhizoctonia solani]
VSSIAVAGQLGIGPVPAAGSKPTTPQTTTTVSKPTTAAQSTTTAKPATTAAPSPTKMTTVTVKPTTTAASGGSVGTVAKYGQCGGQGYTGATQCASGSTCKFNNEWYSQCL